MAGLQGNQMSDFEDLARRHWSFVASMLAGILISVVTADQQTPAMAFVRLVTGLFCALLFTDPILDWLGREPDIYRNATAALLAVSGYAVARLINNLRWSILVDLLKAWRR